MYHDAALTAAVPAREPTGAVALTVEVVRSADRLAEIGPSWDALSRQADGSLFQSHAWIEAWWRTAHDRHARCLAIGLCWRGTELQGVLSLAVTRWRGLRVLEWAAKDQTDYCDALVAPGADTFSVIGPIWDAVERACPFDLAYLSHLLPDAAARCLLERTGRLCLRPTGRATTSLRIDGAGSSGAAWFDGLSKKIRKDLRRKQRLLAETGPTAFRLVAADEALGPIVDRLAELKREWAGRQGVAPPLLADDAYALHHLVGAMAASGRLRLFLLQCDGAIVAGAVAVVEHGTTMIYLIAHDSALGRASPGLLLMVEYVRWSFDQGLGTVDFLCGDEAFKRRFANRRVAIGALAGGRTWRGRLALRLDEIRAAAAAFRARRKRGMPPPDAEDG